MDEDLVELQMRVAFQDDALRKLEETVAAQEKALWKLSQQLEDLRQRVLEGDDEGIMKLEDEAPPPHY